MQDESMYRSIQCIMLALEEVNRHKGNLPTYDDPSPEDGTPPATLLELATQYAGPGASKSNLEAAIEAIAPLFPSYTFAWK